MKSVALRLMLASAGIALCSIVIAADSSPLVLESKIALGDVSGRIDHLAIDSARNRLFVAELGSDSVGTTLNLYRERIKS